MLERDGFGGAGVGAKRVREHLFAVLALALPQVPVVERGCHPASPISGKLYAQRHQASARWIFLPGRASKMQCGPSSAAIHAGYPHTVPVTLGRGRKSSRSDDLTQRYIRRTLHIRQLTALFLVIRLLPDDTQICDYKGHFEYSYCNLKLL